MTVLQFMTNNRVLLEDSPGSNPSPVQTSVRWRCTNKRQY